MKNQIAKAKKYYESIGRVWCPVLRDYIVFNSIGFRHLIKSGRHPRSNADKARRLRLLQFVVDIVKNPEARVTIPESKNPNSKLWIITETRDNNLITVVIRQIGNGNKHFFSIYN